MYVTLEPCPMCASAIIQSRIKNLYFGSYDTKYGALGSALDLRKVHNSKLNVFGAILVSILMSLICPIGTIIYWIYKLCTCG